MWNYFQKPIITSDMQHIRDTCDLKGTQLRCALDRVFYSFYILRNGGGFLQPELK